MTNKKIIIELSILLMVILAGCASEKDKSIAQSVFQQISEIGDVTLEKANNIYDVQQKYNELTDTQKKLVKNYEILNNSTAELEELVVEEEIKNDPTNSIKQEEMTGIWREDDASDSHRGYFYFTKEGYIYYLSSKATVTQSNFTSDYILSTSFSINEYNRETRKKDGEFFCVPLNKDIYFSVSKAADGEMTLDISDSTCGGIYHKTGEKIDTSPKQCLHTGCNKMAVTTGDSQYCEIHSNKCAECGCYIDEDALFCLNCLVEALRQSK